MSLHCRLCPRPAAIKRWAKNRWRIACNCGIVFTLYNKTRHHMNTNGLNSNSTPENKLPKSNQIVNGWVCVCVCVFDGVKTVMALTVVVRHSYCIRKKRSYIDGVCFQLCRQKSKNSCFVWVVRSRDVHTTIDKRLVLSCSFTPELHDSVCVFIFVCLARIVVRSSFSLLIL